MSDSIKQFIPNSVLPGSDWPKRYNDAAIDDGTIFCYDFADSNSWVKQAASANGDTVTNLVDGGPVATITGTMAFGGGGLDFTITAGQKIALPSASRLAENTEDFLWAYWFKHGTQTQAIYELGGYHYADTGPYGIRSISANNLRIIVGGILGGFTLTPGSINAIHVAREKIDSLTYKYYIYVNGTLLTSGNMPVLLQQPSTAVAEAALGDAAGTTYLGYWNGRLYRSWLTTKHLGSSLIAEKVAQDIAFNTPRFS